LKWWLPSSDSSHIESGKSSICIYSISI
jgi:hypothetical protein